MVGMSDNTNGKQNSRQSIRIKVLSAAVIFLAIAGTAFIAVIRSDRLSETPVGDIDGNRFLLDTVVSIKLYESDDEKLLDEAFDIIAAYEAVLSRHIPGSDVTRVNENAGNAVKISLDTRDVLISALAYASQTEGAFDPTIGPLVDLWGIGGESERVPGTDEIHEVLQLVDYRGVSMEQDEESIMLELEGMKLDLGGVAKGWIADEVESLLREGGARHILINLGGNVRVSGGKPGGDPFRIGMQDPREDRGSYLGIFSLSDGSVVSSGVYERFFEKEGIRYHHILDTSTGYPVDNGLAAVTIISELSVDGDALSTSLFALGLEKGLILAGETDGVEAAFVMNDGRVVLTEGAAEIFEATRNGLEVEIRRGG